MWKISSAGVLGFVAAAMLSGCETVGPVKSNDASTTSAAATTPSAQSSGKAEGEGSKSAFDIATTALKKGLFGEGPDTKAGAFKSTGLYGYFKGKDALGDGWPRLAITISKLPPGAYKPDTSIRFGGPEEYMSMCMTYSAVLWTSAKAKKEIPSQEFCWRDVDRRYKPADTPFFIAWGYSVKLPKGHTDTKRTSGPNPPRTSMPEGSSFSNFPSTRGSYLLTAMLAMMDFDPASADAKRDYRVWVVTMPSEVDQINAGEDLPPCTKGNAMKINCKKEEKTGLKDLFIKKTPTGGN